MTGFLVSMRSCWSTFHVTFIHLTVDTSSLNVGLKCPEPRKEQSGQEEATTINEEVDDFYSVVKYLIAKGGRSAWNRNRDVDDKKLAETPACSSMNMTPDTPDLAEAAILQLETDYAWIEQPA